MQYCYRKCNSSYKNIFLSKFYFSISQMTNFVHSIMKEKSGDKREDILLKAEELFAKGGFDSTSTRALAKAANVNLGMLTYYFGTKDKILQALIDRKLGFYRDSFVIIENLDIPTIQKVEAIIDIYVEHMIANRRFHRILQAEVFRDKMSVNLDYAHSVLNQNREFINHIIEQGKQKKEFRDADCRMFMCAITGAIGQIIKADSWALRWVPKELGVKSIEDKKYQLYIKTFLKDLAHRYLLNTEKTIKKKK